MITFWMDGISDGALNYLVENKMHLVFFGIELGDVKISMYLLNKGFVI